MSWRRWGLVGGFCTLPLTLRLGGGWEVNATPRPLYPRKTDPVPTVQESLWASRPVWMGAEESPLAGFDPRSVQPVASRCTDYAYFDPWQKKTVWNCTLFWSHKGTVLCLNVRASTSNLIVIIDWGSLEVKVAQKTKTCEAPTNRVDTVLFLGTSDLMRKGGECKYRRKEINTDIFKHTSILNE